MPLRQSQDSACGHYITIHLWYLTVIFQNELNQKLWKHQEDARDRAKTLSNFALFMEPGVGKTLSTVAILCDKYRRHQRILNTLVLTPPVVIEQWEREFQKAPGIPKGLITPLTGPNLRRIKLFEQTANTGYRFIAITNYEVLYNRLFFNKLLEWAEVLVCDESSKLKEPSAKRSKLSYQIAKNCKYRYILSGTPILSSPMDIFQQFLVMDLGETFGKNFYKFRAEHFVDKNASWKGSHNYFPNWVPKEDCNKNISHKIAPLSIHVKKEEAIELPDFIKKEVFVEMSMEQKKAYHEMRDFFVTIVNDKACVAELVLTKILRLQQIVSGFVKLDDDTEKEFYEVPRLDALSSLLEEIVPVEKVIVWASFKKNYEQIKKVCNKFQYQYAELTGEVSDKQIEIDRFQNDPNCRVLIGNQQSGGIGVNLTAAGTSIFYSKNFSLESDVQAEARNFRGGSINLHKKVTRIDLVSKDTIDSIINLAIRDKLQTNDEILSLIRRKL